jgi:hypothetical protein
VGVSFARNRRSVATKFSGNLGRSLIAKKYFSA